MSVAIYPGSFDPITKGHLNIIERAAKIFDKVIVCVMVNAEKKPMFLPEERVQFIRNSTKHITNVEVDFSAKLLADYARERNVKVVVKGLRAATDFEKEFQMALINKKINSDLETMFLTSEHQFMYLSSRVVKELGGHSVDLTDFLPEAIIPAFQARLHSPI